MKRQIAHRLPIPPFAGDVVCELPEGKGPLLFQGGPFRLCGRLISVVSCFP